MSIRQRFALFSVANIWRAVVGIGVLPLTTLRLDAADFGFFAIIMAVAGASLGLSGLGSNQILSAHLPTINHEEKRKLVTTVLSMSAIIALFTALIVFLSWSFFARFLEERAAVENAARLIAVALILAWTPWTVASAVATIEGRALGFATIVIGETSVNAIAILIAVFYFELGGLSLLVGALAGAVANMAGSLWILRRELRAVWSARWARDCLRVGALSIWSGAGERAIVVLERVLLATNVSAAAVGYLSHGQQYQGIARMGMKSWTNAFWPEALAEGKDPASTFQTTRRFFARAHLLLSLCAIGTAAVGLEAIALLTNDKLTAAYVPAVVLLILVQVEYMARPQIALLYANGRYLLLQTALIASQLLALVIIVPAIMLFGIFGALATQAAQTILYRSLLARFATKVRRVSSQDDVALWGVAGTATVLVAAVALPEAPLVRLAIGGGVAALVTLRYISAAGRVRCS